MTLPTPNASPLHARSSAATPRAPWAARSAHALLARMQGEALLLHDARGPHRLGQGEPAPGLRLRIHDDRVYARTLRDGDIAVLLQRHADGGFFGHGRLLLDV